MYNIYTRLIASIFQVNKSAQVTYIPPWENSLSPSALNANASTLPFIFRELIHSLDYNQQVNVQNSKQSDVITDAG